jgi:hypothetical protein
MGSPTVYISSNATPMVGGRVNGAMEGAPRVNGSVVVVVVVVVVVLAVEFGRQSEQRR